MPGSLLGQAHPRSPAGRATLANPPSARALLVPVLLRPRGPRTPAGLLLRSWDSVCLPHPVSHPGLRWSRARPARGLCTGLPGAWSRSPPGAAGNVALPPGQARGVWGAGRSPGASDTSSLPHIPAFAGGSHRHQRILSGMLFVLYF